MWGFDGELRWKVRSFMYFFGGRECLEKKLRPFFHEASQNFNEASQSFNGASRSFLYAFLNVVLGWMLGWWVGCLWVMCQGWWRRGDTIRPTGFVRCCGWGVCWKLGALDIGRYLICALDLFLAFLLHVDDGGDTFGSERELCLACGGCLVWFDIDECHLCSLHIGADLRL